MEMILWTNDELKRIKPILNKFNLKLNDDYSISEIKPINSTNIYFRFYHNEIQDLETLFYFTDRKSITETLKLTSQIRYLVARNKKHPFVSGLLTDLARIDINDDTEIFTIFIGILSLYKKTSYNYAKKIVDCLKEPELIREKINKIKNSDIETPEEKHLKDYINKKLSFTNGIIDSEIFKPMIEKYNSNIKNNLVSDLKKNMQRLLRKNEIEQKRINDNYEIELILKNRSKSVRRINNEGNYMD